MFKPVRWIDEILDTSLSTETDTGNGSTASFVLSSMPLYVAKVTVGGTRVFNWFYNPATYTVIFDTAPASGTAIVYYYYAEIQAGTEQSAANFNNDNIGAFDSALAMSMFSLYFREKIRLLDGDTLVETQEVTLTNSDSWPRNGSQQTVGLTNTRASVNYSVEYEIESNTGNVGDIHITDKAVNGFKIAFDGSATSVTLKLTIKGGGAAS